MAESAETGGEEFTKDGSVDLNGNPVLRSKTGGWTACSFVVVYEVFERMAYYGISANLVLYLTNRLHQGTVQASNNVTNWVGSVFLMPILGAYVADAHLGRYWTFVLSSIIYLAGMLLLTLAVSIRPLKPATCNSATTSCAPATTLQLGAFFAGLYILALGTGGTKPNISTIGADQFDDFDPGERRHKLSFFNWWLFSIFVGTLFANTFLVYLQDNVGWTIGYGIPTLGLIVSVAIFLVGTPYYRHRLPQGSPFTKMARVIAAAVRKWRIPIPNDPKELHELELGVYKEKGRFRIDSTSTLRFLNKAAVRAGPDTPWTLCPVTQVEETKQILRLIPIQVAMFIPCTMIAQINTLFIKQGTTLDRRIGPRFEIPAASLGAFVTITMLVSIALYDRYFVKLMRGLTGNPRGITLLQRIGVGLALHVVTMATASLTERRRLGAARAHGLVQSGGQVPVTIFVLLPQFVLMGLADAFMVVGSTEFFYDQAPESMKSLGASFSLTTYGVGNFLSSVLLSVVSDVTDRGGEGWVLNNLNASHLDYYYGFLTALTVLNLVFYLFVSRVYTYKAEAFESGDDGPKEEEERKMNVH
ncbi:protein NRT1/ PTR FAMILY 5.2-like [Iris pallida]|uniref:Protein NRT1/ PTR FAMILY 5.2-like n=1 Tax=Iris pallida TaxID=29817 RepID=A0AAX6GKJ6_IRIPA|nr:protein NRT1/ PTR FAMILY 5.2-like [Iris pallida]KAJ6828807.1 protein NRT1/ PTR FAMILY 5.2-like [Iris pallida]